MFKPFLLTAGLLLGLGGATAGTTQYDLRVDGMTCPFCVATSERALKKIEGVEAVATDLDEGIIHVCTDDSVSFSDEELTELFLDKGFTYRGQTTVETCAIARDDEKADG